MRNVEIYVPRSKVIELFDNPDHMPKWQPDLVRSGPISGISSHSRRQIASHVLRAGVLNFSSSADLEKNMPPTREMVCRESPKDVLKPVAADGAGVADLNYSVLGQDVIVEE